VFFDVGTVQKPMMANAMAQTSGDIGIDGIMAG
jgi:hypothetical protein